MKRRSFVFPAILLVGCGSAPQQRPGVRIAVGGRAALEFIPVYLAALGFFRDEGIDVTLQDLASTPKALQALLGGSTDVVAGVYDGGVQMSIERNFDVGTLLKQIGAASKHIARGVIGLENPRFCDRHQYSGSACKPPRSVVSKLVSKSNVSELSRSTGFETCP